MYLVEWILWRESLADEARRKEINEFDKRMGSLGGRLPARVIKAEYTQPSVSNHPRPFGPYYAYNDRFMEIRAGFMENYRGVITAFTLLILIGCIGLMVYGLFNFFDELINKEPDKTGELYFVIGYTLLLFGGSSYFCIRYGRYLSRLEVFTLRHMRVRFNRVTRQVYIQRPAYCGGNLTLRWDDIICDVADGGQPVSGEEDTGGMGLPNIIVWHPYRTGLPFGVMISIGKKMMSQQDLLDEWEFIRRYMEEGPANLPVPRKASLLPLPWHGFSAHMETVGSLYRLTPGIMKLPLVLFLTPVMIFLGMAYWASELLCWQPRWPKVIRQAGLPGMPLPPLTQLTDYPPDIQQKLRDNASYWDIDKESSVSTDVEPAK
ncbi:DUF6708 domain-containing protein [Pragia fontium]|uniref:DUF6708 domain-containing protein n=1 Tax=Pragia fontium TaxID=82985 RepID=A0ABQ5LFX8_9GAMM|nr:hypothetical protein [Pragia fontium]GKX61841.1 hypothetical protein SOASR032_04100 [Pragia fontium]VEJ55254.1 Uncharacterised protein [Pragia fontium]